MRIDWLEIKNYCGFESLRLEFDPHFNLLVGDNASGKTSVLDAVHIAAGSWLLGVLNSRRTPQISEDDVRLVAFPYENNRFTFERQYPVSITAGGIVAGHIIEWTREKVSDESTTRYSKAIGLRDLGNNAAQLVRSGQFTILPLISSYGTERLWVEPDFVKEKKNSKLSRFDGYKNISFLISESDLFDWIRDETLAGLVNHGVESIQFQVIKKAMVACIEDATNIYYDVNRKDLVVSFEHNGIHLFNHLSDGQRVMLTLIGDIAKKAYLLNPNLNDNVLNLTEGIVTIDELDLHLHPKWQRHIIHDLKKIFPKIQFIASTHSPQLIGEAESKEVILLAPIDRTLTESPVNPPQSFGMDSNWVLKHIMKADERDLDIKTRIEAAEVKVHTGDLKNARQEIDGLRHEIGNHPDLVRLSTRIDLLSRKAQ